MRDEMQHRPVRRVVSLALVLPLAWSLTAGVAAASDDDLGPAERPEISHPGTAPWERVPRDDVARECNLDPDLLDAAEPSMSRSPYVIVRYGKLCWAGGDQEYAVETLNTNSASKTFGALLFGLISGRTDVDELTPISDWHLPGDQSVDIIATGLTQPPANPTALMYHALTSTGHNPVLDYGLRTPWSYDAVGYRGMNSLVPIMDKIVQANPDAFPGSTSALDVARAELFAPLGMAASDWDGVVIAHTWNSNVYDMARLGLLMLRDGRWGEQQLVDPEYVHNMTHPQIEDVHTGYGYLTWLNAAEGVAALFDFKTDQECSPYAGWQEYPHAPTFEAPDDNGGAPFHENADVGVFWADGAGGQFIYVHPGLDLVIVVRDDEAAQEGDPDAEARGSDNPTGLEFHRMWRLIRPALVAMDPVYAGDEEAFCEAYRSGVHAPDLVRDGQFVATTVPVAQSAPSAVPDATPSDPSVAAAPTTEPSVASVPIDDAGATASTSSLPATGGGLVPVALLWVASALAVSSRARARRERS